MIAICSIVKSTRKSRFCLNSTKSMLIYGQKNDVMIDNDQRCGLVGAKLCRKQIMDLKIFLLLVLCLEHIYGLSCFCGGFPCDVCNRVGCS